MPYKTFSHIIHRQVLELTLQPGIIPAEAQEWFKNNFYEALPQIENIFSSYDETESLIGIDKIVLDLGRINYEKLDDLFSSRLCKALSDALSDLVISRKTETENCQQPRPLMINKKKNIRIPAMSEHFSDQATSYDIGSVRDQVAEEAISEAFIYFLINGIFPWWMKENKEENIETIFMPVATDSSVAHLEELIGLLKKDKNALKRLLYQFSENFINQIQLLVQQHVSQELSILYETIKRIWSLNNKNTDENKEIIYSSKTWLSFEIMLADSTSSATDIVIQGLRQAIKENKFTNEDLIELLDNESLLFNSKEAKEKIYAAITLTPDQQVEPVKLPFVKSRREILFKENKDNSTETQENKIEPDKSIDEYIYVDYAGLVLLHPFLPSFFSTLKLLDDGQQFMDEGSQARAVHLLAFLATGKMNSAETELPFCKFLCGMSLKEAITKDISHSEVETEECEQLLEAVIRHWTVLKNTSPLVLREAFLDRKGKLDFREANPVLFVETKAHDIILEKLPWGISYIQLPWINKPFTTMWN